MMGAVPALQIRHGDGDEWIVAATWPDGRLENIASFETETDVVAGSAKDGLIEYAQKNEFDLIVMGNSIRSLLFRHLLGDTALNTIQNADRPLFLAQ